MSRVRIATMVAAPLCVLAGCAQQPYQAAASTPNPWSDTAQVAAAEAPAPDVAPAPPVYTPPAAPEAPNPDVGGTKHGVRVMPEAPAAPMAPPVQAVPLAAPTPATPPARHAAKAPAPAKPAAPAKVAPAKPAVPAKAAPAKAAAPAKPKPPAAPVIADGKSRTQAPLRTRPALESAGKQILGAGAPLRLVTQLENDAGMWWYVETESGAQGWVRDSEIQR
jgi:hypothetical protein